MKYIDEINKILPYINTQLVDFSVERIRGTAPTQVSSEFLTNKEQGDWAEKTLLKGINNNSEKYVAVKYGRDDDIIAGEDNFKEFYEEYQNELDDIGKRPDILIFDRKDYPFDEYNISKFDRTILDELVPKAKCGIEVRSSAFLINKYESYMNERQNDLIVSSIAIKNKILNEYGDLLRHKDPELFKIVQMMHEENLHVISFRCKSWRTSERLLELSSLLKDLKNNISDISKRTFLSITPKVEDIKVVYNWVKKYNVPHYYVQVFFDKAYGVSFKRILELISNPDLEDVEYFVEEDVKNQNKTTIKIHANREANILEKVDLPKHFSEMKELGRGRLLYFVKFEDSVSTLNKDEFERLFGFKL